MNSIQVSDDDIDLLLDNNITTIVGLRSNDEVQLKTKLKLAFMTILK
ncbi:hypothetical protein [Clostridium carboxidivorans]|nr:hypothetical protein [Clostridium carboxidivorans]EFG86662.1 hypothetical protein CLCAR_3612 [Clostridium carboxidivorans P7]